MKRAERLARHYIRAADLRAVYVATRGREVKIGITRDPAARARDLKRQQAKLAGVYWFASSAGAAAVVAGVARMWPGIESGTYGATEKAVTAAIQVVATNARVGFSDDAGVQRRAAAVVADIDRRVKAMQSSGHLRGLNADYRAARAEASRRGLPFHSYGDHLERYKIGMLYELARATK